VECRGPRAGWARSSARSPAPAQTARAPPRPSSALPPAELRHRRQLRVDQPKADIWPGDVLSITANGQTLNVVVRQVTIVDGNAVPELLTYRIAFANDWADSLGVTLSEAIAPDSFLPPTAETEPGAILANLQQLTVASATTTALQIDAGANSPTGGGFEVRLRDWDFGPGVNQNLVLRSPVRGFSIPRSRRWSAISSACSTPRIRRSTRALQRRIHKSAGRLNRPRETVPRGRTRVSGCGITPFCLRARVHPCRISRTSSAALAVEVRRFHKPQSNIATQGAAR